MKIKRSYLVLGLAVFFTGCGGKQLDFNAEALDIKPVEQIEAATEYLLATDTEDSWEDDYEDDWEGLDGDQEFGARVVDGFDEDYLNSEEPSATIEYPSTETSTESSTEQAKSINLVVFGNSVTCNEESDLWKSSWGMAASSEDSDYVHVLTKWLASKGYSTKVNIVSIKEWELAKNRKKEAKQLAGQVNEDTDYVLLQTGENVTEYKDTLEDDYKELLSRLKEKAPGAVFLVMAELLWPKDDIESAKKEACLSTGVQFLSMDEFLAEYEKEYKSAIGAVVKADDGSDFTINNEVVAAHPNDAGMKKIAEILEGHLQDLLWE